MTKADYYEPWLWAERDRHRLINEVWVQTKRAIQAESEIRKLKQQIVDMRMQPELLFPASKSS